MAKIKLESGMYQDALAAGLTFSDWLQEKALSGEPGFNWYNPEEKTEDGQPLDAYEQALKHFGIRVRGEKASTGEVFFYDPNARVLFPEFLERTFRWAEGEGMNEARIDDLIAGRVQIDTNAYRSEYLDDGQDAPYLEVEEGAELPTLVLKRHDQAIKLRKYGGTLKMSYESIRRMRLDVLSTFVQKVALDTRRAKVRRAIQTLINGDGNANPAPSVNTGSTTLSFGDLVDLVLDFQESYEPNVFIGDKSTVIRSILKLDVFTAKDTANPQGSAMQQNGDWPRPLGKDLRFVTNVSELLGPNKVLAVDKRFALQEIVEGGSTLTETDRLITSQFQVITFSETLGYAKLMTQASRLRALV